MIPILPSIKENRLVFRTNDSLTRWNERRRRQEQGEKVIGELLRNRGSNIYCFRENDLSFAWITRSLNGEGTWKHQNLHSSHVGQKKRKMNDAALCFVLLI